MTRIVPAGNRIQILFGVRIFISWSGKQSLAVAEALHDWLPRVIQQAKPWMSKRDIEAGTLWGNELHQELEQGTLAIICTTASSLTAPWVLYEAGAFAAKRGTSRVMPYLIGVSNAQVTGSPLSLFQAKKSDCEGTLELVQDIRKLVAPDISSDIIDEAFNNTWPKLQAAIGRAMEIDEEGVEAPPTPTTEEALSALMGRMERCATRLESPASGIDTGPSPPLEG